MQGLRSSRLFRVVFYLFISILSININADSASPITIYVAKKIITMDPTQAEATAVAVKEGKIYAVGSLDEMQHWMKSGTYQVNKDFDNEVIVPGLIEAHCHISELALSLPQTYVGFYDYPTMGGKTMAGLKTKAAIMNQLRAANRKIKDPNQLLFAWGLDPIFYPGETFTATDLDQISKTRPIFILNASGHIAYVNSFLLNKVNYTAQTTTQGVLKDRNGQPNGVLEEMAAIEPVFKIVEPQIATPALFMQGLYAAGDVAHRAGLTTVSDLYFAGPMEQAMIAVFKQATNDPKFPERIVVVHGGDWLYKAFGAAQGVQHLQTLQQQNTNKLRFGNVKFVIDGSIQGFTARLLWPGYFNGAANGIFNLTEDQLKQYAMPFWQAGFPIHVHVNGNEATEVALNVLEYLQNQAPRKDSRFILEHDQMSSPEQFQRAKKLGAQVNLFANQIYYWGDQHYKITMGPNRANIMDDAAEAKRAGLIFSLHTDSPITPLGPLHSMWSAMNRVTASGRVLGANEKISAEDALRAVTINAAYLLKMENEIGSISVGKRADFTVLADNPLTVPPMKVKDIPVVATILDNVVYPVK